MSTIVEFLAYLKSLDVQVSVEGDRLRCHAPEGTLTPELRQQLVERKAELLVLHQQPLHSTSIQPAAAVTTFPLSFAQQRLWFLYQLAPNNPFYNVPAAIRLQGTLNQAALEHSFNEIVRRHAALRTTFKTVDGQPVQVIASEIKLTLSLVDLQFVPLEERDRLIQQLATAEAQRPFNLSSDLLLRVTLLQFHANESILLLTMHHIVADGWSLGILVRELACFYSAFVQEEMPTLPALPIQYADFACWQRNELEGLEQLSYWRSQLQNLPVLELQGDRSRPPIQTYRGATYRLQYSPTLTQALVTLSQQAGVSLFMLLLAAFQTLLYRYTGQEDIAVGSPIANRHRSELEDLIGFFVNSLVLRTNLSGNPTFRELLQRVRDVALAAYMHQDLPFEKLVEELDPQRDLSRNPLFQVAFALQNAPMQPLELPGVTLEPVAIEPGTTRFDLEVHLWEPNHGLRSLWQSQEGLSGFVAYSEDLFDRATIGRLIGHFQTLLEGIVANPDARLSELSLLTSEEQQQLCAWNNSSTASKESIQECFHQIFEAQAQQFPEAIAVVGEDESLTYQQLNHRADQLAQTLQHIIQPNDLVGLCVERSPEMVIGILGILKAGGAYVPLDPQYPRDRLQFILEDTQMSIVLTQSWLVEKLPVIPAQLCLDQLPEPDQTTLRQAVGRDNLAYVIYTSGSTGTPKGVLITHRGLCNVVAAQCQIFHASRPRVLQFSSLSFDASVFEIALALGSGGTLYIPPKSALPGTALIQFLQDNAITHALLTPAVLSVLPATELPALQTLITGGEACSPQIVDRWAANRRFFNAYGPTETTIWATVGELLPGQPITIGRPVANTQVYILDTALNQVPIGVPGEIYIGGAGLAHSYLNRPELTAQRFVANPFDDECRNPRLYQTGDRARYRPDGTIEFLGRIDTQIKIRGFRVELGEIEATLQRHPAIQDAVTIAFEAANDLRLIAYFSLKHQQVWEQSLQMQQVQHWQTLYNQTYQAINTDDFDFNITGWNSSYTKQPIPVEQMQEWVSDRVEQILALHPQRVLEIGCGTGLLLFQIAPHCQSYWATDFSTSLEGIQRQLDDRLAQVKLLHQTATDFTGIPSTTFDVVILNSVVQYFPSLDYLIQVLEKAIEASAPKGVVFIGDVRSLPLLTAFHTWMQSQAEPQLEQKQLRQQVERSRFEEPELAIDPKFFNVLRDYFPRIQRVQIHLTRGYSHNEMTQFRYNVLLHIDEAATVTSTTWRNWKQQPLTVSDVQNHLRETEPEIFGIANITNSRVNAAVQTANWLFHQSAPKALGRMREVLQSTELAIDPQDWWELESLLPYRVEIGWSTQTQTGDYDVVFIRHGVGEVDLPLVQQQAPPTWSHYANNPLQAQFARQLIPQLREHLGQTLPDYMIPSAFIPVESFSLTSTGKVDRRVLPEVTSSSRTTIASRSPTEFALAEIWQELHLKSVSIHDNFFELGGHSLLATQLVSRVRDVFGVEMPLRRVFESPTIAQLALVIEQLRNTSPQQPPLVRLDRASHRRLRSSLTSDKPAQNLHQTQSPQVTEVWSPLVPLTIGKHKQPFFCVHPIFGIVFPYLELAHYLGSDRSFYGLQPLGLDGKHPPFQQIEAMATYYIQAIQTVQPHGPYFLGGWSFGGLVAFEMAQQLTQLGQEVALLAILDTPAPIPANQPSLGHSLKLLLKTAIWSTLPFLLDYSAIVTNLTRRRRQNWFSRWQWLAIANLIPEESQLRLVDESAIGSMLRIFYANSQAAYRYLPQHYPNRITLFKTIDSSFHQQDSTLGWSQLAKDIQIHQVPGNHLSMLKQPHVQTLAQQLQQYL
ncbi:non-ribosomal peptide synthetase [Gloeocapsopsis dulcis]|uniref:Non-ribosomal peptide synthetase n=1 Tax=Gloeocapsopsis dulcis AAB1 = 1H9 TaxID=1433147 RepID=A0A6N8G1M5_9CHRO|nr:non-ribosomal peptide synthetase [Gloeocapsopsis dulcis]MUL38495.1 non-ribosomal peptide synthetase [Gloeocapsopsis dulcis AAB1 = 1H9]WNN91643.1 non-ribosomal peptide synthetase [Gloeocapsopsis dulcis]